MKLISRTAAAKLLDCTPQTVTNYAKQGLIDEVRRDNKGRVTLFYYEEQLLELIPELHNLEELKSRIQAEEELLLQHQANLAAAREQIRKEHFKLNGGKQTLAHLRKLVVAAYNYVQKSTPVTKEQFEEDVLEGLLNGFTVDEVVAATRSSKYRVEKAVSSIAKRMVQAPSLIKENAQLKKEVERLTQHNKMLQMTTDYRVQSQRLSVTKITTTDSGANKKEQSTIPSVEQFKVTPVDTLAISDAAKACLKYNGIYTLFDLLRYKERELSDMKKIGIDRASEINSYLMRLGVTLGITKGIE